MKETVLASRVEGKVQYRLMEEVTHKGYLEFASAHRNVEIENTKVALRGPYHPTTIEPPGHYSPETETIWSFPDRGDWATHNGNYRGNWTPHIPRNLILKFTSPGDIVIDQMVGSGTTLVECKLLGRAGIGIDINLDAVMVTRDRLYFTYLPTFESPPEALITTFVGDCRNLDRIESDSASLIATHPPYAGIISYSKQSVPGDLSSLKFEDYLAEMYVAAKEAFRVLKPGKHCAVLIGDTRKKLHYIPISHRVMLAFLDVGFLLREDIIKIQWKTKATRERWRGSKYSFYKIAHEHLFIFRKPSVEDKLSEFRHSSRWWRTDGEVTSDRRDF